jgi:7,8-dihydropterin-6-yl-methyl-4-(beta-D-ribofuranosyl)aminobenzene 5'-phosphate synthase
MKIVYDNFKDSSTCRAPWGFSAYVDEYKLLFDTGGNGRILLQNLRDEGIDIGEIEYLFITHEHWDHIGGIDSVLELNKNLTIFVPLSFSKNHIEDLRDLSKKVVVCGKKPQQLFENVYTTGILGKDTPEQALVIDDKFPKVITGCGHFGIENIVKVARKIIKKDIKFAIGGFHQLHLQKDEIVQSISRLKEQGIKKVLPTHCTGDLAIELYKKSFGENFTKGGIGSSVVLL